VRGRRIGLVFQDAGSSLDPVRSLGTQLAEVIEVHTPLRGAAARARARDWLAQVGLAEVVHGGAAYPFQLSGGQQQRFAIALALACEPEFLIADEPTSALDADTQGQVLDLLQALQRERGLGLLLITHDLAMVAQRAQVAVSMPAPERPMRMAPEPPPMQPPARLPTGPMASPVLTVDTLCVTYPGSAAPTVQGVSLRLMPGRTLALVGASGSGKTTTAKAIVRLLHGHAEVTGRMTLAGHAWSELGGAALRRARGRVQMVFQDALASFDPRQRVGEALAEGLVALRPEWDAAERQRRLHAMTTRVGLPPEVLDRPAHALSGGQRQRAAMVRALVIEPRVLVCDEPTSALDVDARDQVLDLLRQWQRETGMALLLVSHQAEVVAALADEVAVMDAGRVSAFRALPTRSPPAASVRPAPA
jgi:peptide/nickel transport system ATP-binding protein